MSVLASVPEIIHATTGRFLGFNGRALPLPDGWQAWNAFTGDGRLIGSLVVSVGPPEHLDWEEADYDGPFFIDEAGDEIAVFHCVYIAPTLRGRGLWREFELILAGLELPVYGTFANERLHERFRRRHRPRVLVG